MTSIYTSNGEQISSHIHSLVRLDEHGLLTHGYRYQCRACGARLKKKSGVMVIELEKLSLQLKKAEGKI